MNMTTHRKHPGAAFSIAFSTDNRIANTINFNRASRNIIGPSYTSLSHGLVSEANLYNNALQNK